MYTIAQDSRQYATYIFSDTSGNTQLEVVPERGGIVTRWQVNGQEMLYLDADRFTDPTLSVRGGIPILFPICGNLPDNTYTHNGQTYTLKQHGFARELPWSVADQQADADSAQITLQLESNDRTRALYPFEFQIQFTYRLQGNTLTIRQRYTNASDSPMPFSAGVHPYFAAQDKTRLRFQIPSSEYYDQVTKSIHAYAGQFDMERDEIDAAFTQLSSHVASVVDEARSLRLTITFNPEFSTLVFWTVKGKDFYCLEPWTSPRNALNTGTGLLHLDPSSSLETEIKLVVEES